MITQRNTRSKTVFNGKENSEPIPFDLILEILSRLPVKSIGRCLCVSKLWSSIIRLPYFTELFFTRSSARPHLLFVYRDKGKIMFLSSPQPQNLDENSSLVAANHLSHVHVGGSSYCVDHVHGLVYLAGKRKPSIILNPITGQTLTLDKVNSVASYLGYDPIDKQFKVLSMERGSNRVSPLKNHQVLTLGTQTLEWRMIECSIPYFSISRFKRICINGVLYYPAMTSACPSSSVIICFDVRSEKFSCIKVETTFKRALFEGTIINYKGKLGSLISHWFQLVDGTSEIIELLVIGDFEKQEWSTHKYTLPPLWKDVVGDAVFYFVGVIGTNKIVLSNPDNIIYYNTENNTLVKVGIQEMEKFKIYNFGTFLDYMEDLKLIL